MYKSYAIRNHENHDTARTSVKKQQRSRNHELVHKHVTLEPRDSPIGTNNADAGENTRTNDPSRGNSTRKSPPVRGFTSDYWSEAAGRQHLLTPINLAPFGAIRGNRSDFTMRLTLRLRICTDVMATSEGILFEQWSRSTNPRSYHNLGLSRSTNPRSYHNLGLI